MPTEPLNHVIGQLRKAALADAGRTDGELLDAYLARGDEAAFECLVWRHGPAVLGACRRLLGNEADAEDAFQATFLVLVRKGGTVRPRGAVGAWLYGVACNIARKARAGAARRRAKELAAARLPVPAPTDPDLGPAIDLEVNRLPEKYRVPVVLCELEGAPIADAARTLGWPAGTVASRLARGRDLLARPLARQGLGLAGLSPAVLSPEAVAGVLGAARGPGPAAAHLAEGVVRAMSQTKLKVLTAAGACAAVVLAGGMVVRMAGRGPADPPGTAPAPKVDPPAVKPNPLLGRWRVAGGRPYQVIEFREQPVAGLFIAESADHRADWFSWVVDGRADPKAIDLAEPTGRAKVRYGEEVAFRLYVRNTTDKGADVAVPNADGDRPAWVAAVRDARGVRVPVTDLPDIPNDPVPPTWLEARLTAYQVRDLGALKLIFLPPEEVPKAVGRGRLVPVEPGRYTVRFDGPDGATGEVTLAAEPAVAWGPPVGGVRFGLQGERDRYAPGDTVTLRLYARNESEKGATVEFPEVAGKWVHGHIRAWDAQGNEVLTSPSMAPGFPFPVRKTRHDLPPGAEVEVGTAAWQLARPDGRWENSQDHVVVTPGAYTVAYPDLHRPDRPPWPTGEFRLIVRPPTKPTREPHVGDDGTAWGPAVDDLQFGVRFERPHWRFHKIGEPLALVVAARNWSEREVTLGLPEPGFLAQLGMAPTIAYGRGETVRVTVPPRDSLPEPKFQKFTLPAGAARDLYTTHWPVVRNRPEGLDPYFLVAPGSPEWRVRIDNLADPRQKEQAPRPTGEFRFRMH